MCAVGDALGDALVPGRVVAVKKALTPHGTLIQSFGDGSRWFGPVGNIIKAVALNPLAGQTLKSFTAKVTALPQPERGAWRLLPGVAITVRVCPAVQRVQARSVCLAATAMRAGHVRGTVARRRAA